MSTLSKNVQQTTEDFDAIKGAIIEKGVDVPDRTPTSDYASKIRQIETGITPTGTIDITENQEQVDVTQYQYANVAVHPQGTIDITENGEGIDVAQYAIANVNVETGVNLDDFISGSLTSVVSELESIPDFAFSAKSQLETVELPEALYIGKYAFSCAPATNSGSGSGSDSSTEGDEDESANLYNNDNLRSVVMPKVTHIAKGAFQGDENIEITQFPDSLIIIENNAFKGCPNVQVTQLPPNLTYIGDNALPTQENLDISSLPESLIYVGSGVTWEQMHEYFGTFVDPETNILDFSLVPEMWWHIEFSESVMQGYRSFFDGYLVRNVVIPETVTHIPAGMFAYCDIDSINIPDNVISIGKRAFSASTLVSAVIPSSVTLVGQYAFSQNYHMEHLEVYCDINDNPYTNQFIEIFGVGGRDCSLVSLTLGDAFTEANFSHPWTTLAYCEHLETVVLGSNFNEIPSRMFTGCTALSDISLPNGITTIGQEAFSECSFTAIAIPDSVIEIGTQAFASNDNITSFTFPQNITVVAERVLAGCDNLTEVILPEGVTTIERDPFYYTSLRYLKLPKTVVSIAGSALTGLDTLDMTEFSVEDVPKPLSEQQQIGWVLNPDATIKFNSQLVLDAYAANSQWSLASDRMVVAE